MNKHTNRNIKIIPQPHPELDELSGFVHNSNSEELDDLRVHIATCLDCRQHVLKIDKVISIIGKISDDYIDVNDHSHLSDEDVISYVKHSDEDPVNMGIREHIKSCGICQKSVLKYRTHIYATQTDVDCDNLIYKKKFNEIDLSWKAKFIHLKKRWGSFIKTPAVTMVGVLVGIIASNLLSTEDVLSTDLLVVNYQDESVLTLTPLNEPRGAGFFSTAKQITEPFSGINVITPDQNSIYAEWPEITGAASYNFRLYVIDSGIQKLVMEQSTTMPKLDVTDLDLIVNRRYEWEIGGITENNSFRALGGFVLFTHER